MTKNKKSGKFIVIDGGEGSGKSTCIEFLKTLYSPEKVLFTREPGGTPYAEAIREVILHHSYAKESDPETQFALQWAQRFDHLTKFIIPTLTKGINVVSDRFDSSTWSYQLYGQEAMHLKPLFFEMRKVYEREGEPDWYIFLDVSPEVGLARVANRKGITNHFDERKIDFHQRIRAGFLDFMKFFPSVIIDGNQPLDRVKKDLTKILETLFS